MRPEPGPLRRYAVRRETPRRSTRLLTPLRLAFLLSVIVAGALVLLGLVRRDASQIPILAAGLIVGALAFLGAGAWSAVGAVRAARAGLSGQAFAGALLGGLFVLGGAVALASAIVLSLVWESA